MNDLALHFAQECHRVCDDRCAVCGYTGPFLEAHHVVYSQHLPEELKWEPDNALTLCKEPAPNRCHARHHNATRRVPRSALRPENIAFAETHGFMWRLERMYPAEES